MRGLFHETYRLRRRRVAFFAAFLTGRRRRVVFFAAFFAEDLRAVRRRVVFFAAFLAVRRFRAGMVFFFLTFNNIRPNFSAVVVLNYIIEIKKCTNNVFYNKSGDNFLKLKSYKKLTSHSIAIFIFSLTSFLIFSANFFISKLVASL